MRDMRARRLMRATLIGAVVALTATIAACTSAKPTWSGGAGASGAPTAATTPDSPSGSPSVAATPTWAPISAGKPRPVPGKVLLGAYISLSGKTVPQAVTLRQQQLGGDFAIIHRYYGWNQDMPRKPKDVPPGCTLMISWDGVKYARILNGSQDALIRRAADDLKAYHKPVFLRWAWEMNGDWYNWGGSDNNKNTDQFIAAWRHIHDIFVKEKADNVAFVWGPNYKSFPLEPWNDMTKYYPGDAYVDWIGVSGYFSGRQTPDQLFHQFATFGDRKPLMIAETGSQEHGGTVKADWINQLHDWINIHPAIAALVWFDTDDDHNNGKNWRIDSTPSSLHAYQAMASDPRFVLVPQN